MVKICPSKRGWLLINNEDQRSGVKWIDPFNGDKPFKWMVINIDSKPKIESCFTIHATSR